MRNANAQRMNIMVLASTLQQPPPEHVSYAETDDVDGARLCERGPGFVNVAKAS